MKKSPSWRDLAEAIGVAAIVASLLFVGYQLRLDAQIARAEVSGAFVSRTITMNQENLPYADLIAKANRGDALSEAELYRLDSIVNNMILNIRFLNIQGRRVGEIGSSTNELVFSAHLFRNPGLRAAWERVDSNMREFVDPFRTPESLARTYQSGSGALRDRIEQNLSRLDEMYKEQAL
jgi:hypothetical protein